MVLNANFNNISVITWRWAGGPLLIIRTAIIGLFFFNVCSDNVVQCLTVRYMYHLFFLQINDYVGGLTEVHGQVDGQNNILCNNYIVFPKEAVMHTADYFS
jgi:hypothetical protein